MLTSDDLQFFRVLSTAASLAAAARALNVSAPAVTQRLRALETRLGLRLVDRTGRQLALTDEGELLAAQGGDVLAALGEIEDALAARRGAVTGHLRVVAPFGFGRRHIAPLIASFQSRHPQVQVDLVLSDRLTRLSPDAWDVAIHVGEVADLTPSLTLRTLAANRRLLCASADYLGRNGVPRSSDALRDHLCLALRENDEDVTLWRMKHIAASTDHHVRIVPHLASNDGGVVRDWALGGHGIMMRSEWDVAEDLAAGRLIEVLPDYLLPEAPVVALLGSLSSARAARTRHFLNELIRNFDPPPWR